MVGREPRSTKDRPRWCAIFAQYWINFRIAREPRFQ